MSVNANAPYIVARILGPYCLIAGAALFTQTPRMMGIIDSFLMSSALLLLAGFLSLLSGLLILAFANSWRGFTEILVTLTGWSGIVRGLVIIFAPDLIHAAGSFLIQNPVLLPIFGGILALLGLWLSFQGFFTSHVPENEQLVDTLR